MYICIHTHIHIEIHTCRHTYICTQLDSPWCHALGFGTCTHKSYVYMHIHICIYAYTHILMLKYIRILTARNVTPWVLIHVHTYHMDICIHTYAYVHTQIYSYWNTYASWQPVMSRPGFGTLHIRHMYICIHTHVYMHTHTCIYAYTHIHILTGRAVTLWALVHCTYIICMYTCLCKHSHLVTPWALVHVRMCIK